MEERMKKLAVLTLVLMGSVLYAQPITDGPKVKLTSFILAGYRTRSAEICGIVTGASNHFTMVRITVDPQSKRPGIYYAIAGKDGYFCSSVVTYYGSAKASIDQGGEEVASDLATASPEGQRK